MSEKGLFVMPRIRMIVATMAAAACISGLALSSAPAASAATGHASAPATGTVSTVVVYRPLRLRAWRYAMQQHGKWYCWGGIGPGCFDCSGLLFESYLHHGVNIGRDTFGMLGNWHLRWTSNPRRGDIVFFGTGHVEMYSSRHWTYGASHSGTRIGWHKWWPGSGWEPTAYAHVSRR